MSWIITDGRTARPLAQTPLPPAKTGLRPKLPRLQARGDAWWAMDYHLDWVVGTMAMLSPPSTGHGPHINHPQRLVEGTQEPMDLVVAFGETLILIEAKGDCSWSNPQFHSKIERLAALLESGLVPASLNFFVVLMSPRSPTGLVPPLGGAWPMWLCPGGVLRHVVLEMPQSLLRVTRWSQERGEPSPEGKHWLIVPAPDAAPGLLGEAPPPGGPSNRVA